METVLETQLRSNALVSYIRPLEYIGVGCKETLNQSLKTIFCDDLNKLGSIEKVECINEYANKYKNLYDKKANEIFIMQKRVLRELGTLSSNQVKKIKRCVDLLIYPILKNRDMKRTYKEQPYVNFLTLTLPGKQIHTDKVIRRLLSKFIYNLQRLKKVKNYIWVAEAQKNGNIHFHIVLDRWINKDEISSLWNNEIEKLGYISRYKMKTNKENPPTTNIQSLRSVKKISSYITKYMLKDLKKDERPIIGAKWGASNALKKMKYPTFYSVEMEAIKENLKKLELESDNIEMYVGSVYEIVLNSNFGKVTKFLKWYLERVYEFLQGKYYREKDKYKHFYRYYTDMPIYQNLN